MPLLLTLSLLALILSKVADIRSTLQGIRRCGGDISWEQNPLARWAMRRWGVPRGIAVTMLPWCLITALIFAPAYHSPVWHQLLTALGGFFVAWTQWDVARFNRTHRHSWFTRRLLSGYQRWQTRRPFR
jgi:hypothetical protein